jgi:acyl-CoA reductase-like NAD-dependent aldehyde dehydrogenase
MNTDWVSKAGVLKPQVSDFVNGRWIAERNTKVIEKLSPRDGTLLYRLHAGDIKEADNAVAHARSAFEDGRWSKRSNQQRKEALYRLASLMEENREELALMECLDVGKPISDAINFDVPVAAALIRSSAEASDHLYGKVYGADSSSLSYQLRRPIGVVAGIVGWNFPILLAAGKIGPALATGNCLVLKPSELTSLSSARVAELAIEAGVPAGVLNVIHGGPELGAALARHGDVDLVTFTGSSKTGKQLMIAAGESNLKRLVLECGGKAPHIVFDDGLDLDSVSDAIIARAFWNQGQVCTASSRLLVQRGIKNELLVALKQKVAARLWGDPLATETKFGPLVSRGHQQKVLNFVEIGEKEGATLAYAYRDITPPHPGGYYVPPVILDDVLPEHRIAQEEIFGPVLSVLSFSDEDEAIRIANSTTYGLSAILWTKDLGRAHRMAQGIRAGWIVVNATNNPWGGLGVGILSAGGHKQSGIGVEGGIEGMREYVSQTAVQHFV